MPKRRMVATAQANANHATITWWTVELHDHASACTMSLLYAHWTNSCDASNSKPIALKETMDPSKGWDSAQRAGDWTDPITSTTK